MTSPEDHETDNGLALHVGPQSAGESFPAPPELVEGLSHGVIPDLKDLVLISGPVGSGKTQSLVYMMDKIHADFEKATRATTKVLHPLLERAVEMEVGLTLIVGQKPEFQEHEFTEPETFESDAEITEDDLEQLISEFVQLSPPYAIELRYVLNETAFEVSVKKGESIHFHNLYSTEVPAEHERVSMTSNGNCTIYGDK